MTARTHIGPEIDIAPLVLGCNVFGWTADREASFAVLDAFAAGGGDFLDTADGYSHWVPSNAGGESERIIGEWLASRGVRDHVVVATKVSSHPEFLGLSGANVRAAAVASARTTEQLQALLASLRLELGVDELRTLDLGAVAEN